MKQYYKSLKDNYYLADYYKTILGRIVMGENVLLSSLLGCGGNTFMNYFTYRLNNERIFEDLEIYDTEFISHSEILILIKNSKRKNNSLIIIKNIHILKEISQFLEKLNSISKMNLSDTTFLCSTDYSGTTQTQLYTAKTSAFFNYRFNLLPINKEQTDQLVDSIREYYGWEIKEQDNLDIFEISGGIPRLVKHIIDLVSESGVDINDFKAIEKDPTIDYQLKYLANLLIRESKYDLQVLNLLDDNGEIKSKLLKHYFSNYCDSFIATLYPYFTDLEIKLFSYLYLNMSNLVTIDKMGDLMLMGNNNFSQWAIYKQISRLKPKISDRFLIQNIKGRGYILREKNA